MSMQESSRGQRATGDRARATWAAVIDRIRESRGSDIPLPITEAHTEIQRFTPEQVLGLKTIEFDLIVPTFSKSMDQLVREERKRFGHVEKSKSLRYVVPPAAEVAVRSGQLALPGSNRRFIEDQRQMVADFEKAARKKRMPKGATLTGIDFGLDHASTHAQIDFGFQAQNGGKPLYEDMYARTKDPECGFYVAGVGRNPGDSRLRVDVWPANAGFRNVWAVPVARPARK